MVSHILASLPGEKPDHAQKLRKPHRDIRHSPGRPQSVGAVPILGKKQTPLVLAAYMTEVIYLPTAHKSY